MDDNIQTFKNNIDNYKYLRFLKLHLIYTTLHVTK